MNGRLLHDRVIFPAPGIQWRSVVPKAMIIIAFLRGKNPPPPRRAADIKEKIAPPGTGTMLLSR
jgi:hypothetical protein